MLKVKLNKRVIAALLVAGFLTPNMTVLAADTSKEVASTETRTTKQVSAVKNGWVQENKRWYYYENGVPKKDWFKWDGNWYYLNSDGSMAIGWKLVRGSWYYLNYGGVMQTGWQKIDNKWYYLNSGGVMVTGLQNIGNSTYYFEKGGVMQTGWVEDSNSTQYNRLCRYFDGSGAMKTGWLQWDGNWYYLGSDGYMLTTGLEVDANTVYLFRDNGTMVTGWYERGGSWFYCYSSGILARNTVIDGKYHIDNTGRWVNNGEQRPDEVPRKNDAISKYTKVVTLGQAKITEKSGFTKTETEILNKFLAENKVLHDKIMAQQSYKGVGVVGTWGHLANGEKALDILIKYKNMTPEVEALCNEVMYSMADTHNLAYKIAKREGFKTYEEFVMANIISENARGFMGLPAKAYFKYYSNMLNGTFARQ